MKYSTALVAVLATLLQQTHANDEGNPGPSWACAMSETGEVDPLCCSKSKTTGECVPYKGDEIGGKFCVNVGNAGTEHSLHRCKGDWSHRRVWQDHWLWDLGTCGPNNYGRWACVGPAVYE